MTAPLGIGEVTDERVEQALLDAEVPHETAFQAVKPFLDILRAEIERLRRHVNEATLSRAMIRDDYESASARVAQLEAALQSAIRILKEDNWADDRWVGADAEELARIVALASKSESKKQESKA